MNRRHCGCLTRVHVTRHEYVEGGETEKTAWSSALKRLDGGSSDFPFFRTINACVWSIIFYFFTFY